MRVEFRAPETAFPKKDPENPCPCQFRPFQLKSKKGELFWIASVGDVVKKEQVLCEGEVEKKTVEFLAPCDGTLVEICVEDGDNFRAGDLLGWIESDE